MITVSEQSKQNLQKLLEFVGNLNNSTDVNLDMEYYYNISSNCENYHCNTNLCLAGMIPLVDKEFADKYTKINYVGEKFYDFQAMSYAFIGYSNFEENPTLDWTRLWVFIFASNWPSDIYHAIKRIKFVIDNGGIDSDWKYWYEWK